MAQGFSNSITNISFNTIFSNDATFTSISANTIFSGTTDLSNLFATLTQANSLQSQINTKTNRSGDTFTGSVFAPSLSATTLSGGSIFSGSTNLNSYFNALYAEDISLQNQINTKANRSGDTFTGTVFAPILSATTLSGGTIASAGDITLAGNINSVILGVPTDISSLIINTSTLGLISGGTISPGTGITINVTGGYGYCLNNSTSYTTGNLVKISWSSQSIAIPNYSQQYIYFNSNGVLSIGTSRPPKYNTILLGRVGTRGGAFEFISMIVENATNASNRFSDIFTDSFGVIYNYGSIVTENVTPLQLDITAGDYFYSTAEISTTGGTAVTFSKYYQDGSGGWVIGTANTVDNTSFDNGSGALSALTANYYKKDSLYTVGTDVNEQYFLVEAQAQYSSLLATQQAPLSLPPSYFSDDIARVASIITQQGNPNIVQIKDERQIPSQSPSATVSAADHRALLNLTNGNAGHTQFLMLNGSTTMSGNLNLGGNNLISGGTINASTYISGSTNLYNIFQQLGTSVLSIGQGSNILTGGTSQNTTISLVPSPSVNSLTTSGATLVNSTLTVTGNSTFANVTAITLSANSVVVGISANTIAFGSSASGNGIFTSTTNATKGKIIFGNSAYDELNDRLGINILTPISRLHVVENTTATTRGIVSDQYNNGANSSRLDIRKARGTSSVPLIITSGDVMSNVSAWGYDGTQFIEASRIQSLASGTVSLGVVPTSLMFQTMTTGGTLTTGLTIDSSQNSRFANSVIIGLSANTIILGSSASGNGIFTSTSNATKGKIIFGNSVYDELNDRWGLGTQTASTKLQVVDTITATTRGALFDQYNNGANSSRLGLRKARGTPSIPLSIVSADTLSNFATWAYDGTQFVEASRIETQSSGPVSTGIVPTTMVFQTMTTGGVLTTGLTIDSSQNSVFSNKVSTTTLSATTLSAGTITSSVISGTSISADTVFTRFISQTGATGVTLDSSLANDFSIVLTANTTLNAFLNPADGRKVLLRFIQDNTGGRVLTFNSVYRFGVDFTPNLSSVSAKTDYIGFMYNGVFGFWDCISFTQGY